jgi:hypothetical protein
MAWTAAGLAPYSPGSPRDTWRASLPLGAIIAVAELTGCHADTDCEDELAEPDRGELRWCSPWSMRWQWHWVLRDVRPLPHPVPARGWLGLWRPTPDTERAVMEQIGSKEMATAKTTLEGWARATAE